jgi:hypothetical protein
MSKYRVKFILRTCLEPRRRLEKLLRAVDQRLQSPAHVRAMQVLERIGTKDAEALRRSLAEAAGDPPRPAAWRGGGEPAPGSFAGELP